MSNKANFRKQIGGEFRRAREKEQLTKAAVADAAGIFRGDYAKYEDGKLNITADMAERIATALRKKILDSFAGTPIEKNNDLLKQVLAAADEAYEAAIKNGAEEKDAVKAAEKAAQDAAPAIIEKAKADEHEAKKAEEEKAAQEAEKQRGRN